MLVCVCVCVCVCVYSVMSDFLQPQNMLSLPTTPNEASLVAWMVKKLPANPGWDYPLEREMVTHSSILACEIPWTEEPGGLQSMEETKSWIWLSDLTTTTPREAENLELKGNTSWNTFTQSLSVGRFCIIFIAKTVLSSLISFFE